MTANTNIGTGSVRESFTLVIECRRDISKSVSHADDCSIRRGVYRDRVHILHVQNDNIATPPETVGNVTVLKRYQYREEARE